MQQSLILAALLMARTEPIQYPPGPDKDGTVRVTLTVSAAVPPVPASRWNIYPEYRDLQPGSRVQGLLKCFAEMNRFYGADSAERERLAKLPLTDLPDNLRDKVGLGSGLAYPRSNSQVANIDYGARYSRVEWNEYFDLRRNGISYLIPEVQQLRQLASVIGLRMRGEIKAGEWSRAIESVKTLFGMAQALEQHPTLIGNLVAIAIAQIGVNGLEEMADQPNAPSLYWSLANIPAVPVSTRIGLGGERILTSTIFAELTDARRALSDAEMAKHLEQMSTMVKALDPAEINANPQYQQLAVDPKGWCARIANDPVRLAAAKKRAVERGQPATAVDAMSPAQLVLLDDIYTSEESRDDLFRWYNLPHWQAMPGMIGSNEARAARKDANVLGSLYLPALYKMKRAETRLAQRVALLRAVEAVRLHIGKTGELPTTLAGINAPEPIDPVTGKSFTYTVKDGVATLHGENPHGNDNRFVVEYTIRVRK